MAGRLHVRTKAERLPPAPFSQTPSTEAQRAFGQACRVVVHDEAGALVLVQDGVAYGAAGIVNYDGCAGQPLEITARWPEKDLEHFSIRRPPMRIRFNQDIDPFLHFIAGAIPNIHIGD